MHCPIGQALLRAFPKHFQRNPEMAATPPSPAQGIQPAFKRVQQSDDFDCWAACIATIAGKSLDDIRKVAVEKFKLPAHGPYWVTQELIAKLCTHYGLVATIYKEVDKLADIADVSICLVDYDADTEIGRHVVFVRDKRNPKQTIEYMIDPAYWIEAPQHVRNDFKTVAPAWFIGVHLMK
jgi:hypothetical protein